MVNGILLQLVNTSDIDISFYMFQLIFQFCNNKLKYCIPKVSSVKTQQIYFQLKWRHVSTQGVIIMPIIEPCLRYIKWKCTFLGIPKNVYSSVRTWVQMRLVLTLILPMWRIWWAPNNASRWQMGFNSAFEGLIRSKDSQIETQLVLLDIYFI
jgi:hypothetical protein